MKLYKWLFVNCLYCKCHKIIMAGWPDLGKSWKMSLSQAGNHGKITVFPSKSWKIMKKVYFPANSNHLISCFPALQFLEKKM